MNRRYVDGPLDDADVARFLTRCQTERAEAGLSEKITDPDVLARVAAIVTTRKTTTNK